MAIANANKETNTKNTQKCIACWNHHLHVLRTMGFEILLFCIKGEKHENLAKIWRFCRAVPGSRLPDRNGSLSGRSGLPQHHRPGPKGDPARRQTDGHLFNQPAYVRVLWRFSDCPVAGVVRPVEVRRTGDSCRWQP